MQNKIEEVCSFFSDNYSLFVNLQASQPGHKKILELTENILVLLNKADRPKKDTAKKEFKFLNSKADRSKPIAKKPEESHENGIDQDLIFSSSQPVPNESDIVITTEQPLLLENLSANGTEQPKANLFELENVFGDSSTSTGRIEEVTNKQTSSSKSTGFSFIKPKQKQQTESQIPEIKEEKKNTAKPDLTEILNMAYQPENNDTAQQTNHNPQVTYEQGNYQSYNNIQNHYNPNYPNQINPQIPVETQMNPMYVNPGISNQFGYQYPYNPYVNVSNPMVNPGIYQQTPPYNVPSFMQKINKNIHFKQDEQAQPADDKFDFIKDLMKPKNS